MPVAALGWGLAVIALALWRFNRDSALLRCGQQALVPFYVLHQPIVLFLVPMALPLGLKVLVNVGLALLLTLMIYQLLIRPMSPLRAAFGMKG